MESDRVSLPLFKYTWRIENFDFCFHKNGDCLESPIFKFDSSHWCLTIYPRGENQECSDWISVYLLLCEEEEVTCNVTWQCEIICPDGGVLAIVEESKMDFSGSKGWGTPKGIRQEELFANDGLYVKEGSLTIACLMKNQNKILCPGINKYKDEQTGCTHIETIVFSHTYLKNLDDEIISSLIKDTDGTTWFRLQVLYAEDVIVAIKRMCDLSSFYCICDVLIYDCSGRKHHSGKYGQFFQNLDEKEWLIRFIPNDYDNLRKKNSTIKLKFTVSNGSTYSYTENEVDFQLMKSKNRLPEFKNDIFEIYTEQIACDFTLNSSDKKEFRVHKTVLLARSPVFRRMLSHDTRELSENRVEIEDIDSVTMGHVLKYIYSSDVDNLECDVAIKVSAAADKYELVTLMQVCNDIIRSKLNCTNILKVIKFADMHQYLSLKEYAKEFLLRHGQSALKTDQWKELTQTDAELASEILLYAMEKVTLTPSV